MSSQLLIHHIKTLLWELQEMFSKIVVSGSSPFPDDYVSQTSQRLPKPIRVHVKYHVTIQPSSCVSDFHQWASLRQIRLDWSGLDKTAPRWRLPRKGLIQKVFGHVCSRMHYYACVHHIALDPRHTSKQVNSRYIARLPICQIFTSKRVALWESGPNQMLQKLNADRTVISG